LNHFVKPDSRNCKRLRDTERQVPDSLQVPSPGKSDSSLSEISGLFYKEEALEKNMSDISKEINLMLSTYAKISRERAGVDASYVDELDGLSRKAKIIENSLVQKIEFLKQSFPVITNTLHKESAYTS
ncbi:testis-expressed protein 12-like, partial [Meriones unguiculatus]|uniref:testis-expressed protein 12-like n=1 Tax=Meriones unguiculatus TaxID=10047 RepID=UPI00293ECBDE